MQTALQELETEIYRGAQKEKKKAQSKSLMVKNIAL